MAKILNGKICQWFFMLFTKNCIFLIIIFINTNYIKVHVELSQMKYISFSNDFTWPWLNWLGWFLGRINSRLLYPLPIVRLLCYFLFIGRKTWKATHFCTMMIQILKLFFFIFQGNKEGRLDRFKFKNPWNSKFWIYQQKLPYVFHSHGHKAKYVKNSEWFYKFFKEKVKTFKELWKN